ncbi:MAG: hypothetical protein ACRDZR_19010 [Acidimicrobiales bacterium]
MKAARVTPARVFADPYWAIPEMVKVRVPTAESIFALSPTWKWYF